MIFVSYRVHSKKLQMSNGWQIFLTSACCLFAVLLLSDVSDGECSCALFVHWYICAQTADEYFGHQFGVRLCTNGWRIFWTTICCPFVHKRLTDISEWEGKENSMKIKKITLSENASNYHKIKKSKNLTANGQQTVVRCFSAQTVAWADLYPFALRTSDVRLLSAYCPFAVCLLSVCYPKLFAV